MPKQEPVFYAYLEGLPVPMRALRLRSDGRALTAVDFADDTKEIYGPAYGQEPAHWQRHDSLPVLRHAATELREYFAGTRRDFTVPLALVGTDFQKRVWAELCNIPYAQTWSYVELARRIGQPQASRAVGAANGRNPIPILVPCHRVIGASGQLTGYGGGLPRKKMLLELENGPRLPGPSGELFAAYSTGSSG